MILISCPTNLLSAILAPSVEGSRSVTDMLERSIGYYYGYVPQEGAYREHFMSRENPNSLFTPQD